MCTLVQNILLVVWGWYNKACYSGDTDPFETTWNHVSSTRSTYPIFFSSSHHPILFRTLFQTRYPTTLTPNPQPQILNANIPTLLTEISPTMHEEHRLLSDSDENSLSSAIKSFPDGGWEQISLRYGRDLFDFLCTYSIALEVCLVAVSCCWRWLYRFRVERWESCNALFGSRAGVALNPL